MNDILRRHLNRPTKRAIFADCVSFLKRTPCRVLDVGAGVGLISHTAKQLGHTVKSCDMSKEFCQFPELKIDVCDLNKGQLPYKNGSFDLVILTEVIEHVENPWHLIKECARVLAPGGLFYLSTPNLCSWPQKLHFLFTSYFYTHPSSPKIGEHITHITPMFIRSAMRRYGIVPLDTRFVHAHLPFLQIPMPAIEEFGHIVAVVGRKL